MELPDPKHFVDRDYQYVRGYVRRRRAYPTSSTGIGGGALLLISLGIVIFFLWKFILMFLICVGGLVGAIIGTVKLAKSTHPKLAFIPIPTWMLVGWLGQYFIIR